MVELMEKAIDKLTHLSPEEQAFFAQWILDELEDEQRWEELFAKSRGRFSKLVAKVLADDDAGLTDELDPDTLPD